MEWALFGSINKLKLVLVVFYEVQKVNQFDFILSLFVNLVEIYKIK